jgi:hypothetical protein
VDPEAPSIGTWRGWGKIFLLRSRRHVGTTDGQRLHETVGKAAPETGRIRGWLGMRETG